MNVRTLCLGYLSKRDATGYEIKKDFEEGNFSHFMEASFGSIYPALSQLAAEGLVTVRQEEQPGKPDRKVYSITEQGLAALTRALSVLPARDRYKSEFLFIMLLRQHISPEHQLAAMQKQLQDLRDNWGTVQQCNASLATDPACAFVAGYAETVLTAAVSYLEQQIAAHMAAHKPIAAE